MCPADQSVVFLGGFHLCRKYEKGKESAASGASMDIQELQQDISVWMWVFTLHGQLETCWPKHTEAY